MVSQKNREPGWYWVRELKHNDCWEVAQLRYREGGDHAWFVAGCFYGLDSWGSERLGIEIDERRITREEQKS